MKRYYTAKINWLSEHEGGRKNPPPVGTRYCPLIKLGNGELWSSDFICSDYPSSDTITISMLVEGAPFHMIYEGETYELYEGERLVAVVYIESETESK
ncbi:hypothetical protein [Butyrivibrio sp. MC2013]|uniref:hypothetical protein n=1 Tax=Butyrivibrio sp. MC2013 TaxID=1280686 RepID=UPI00047D418F|nr:hypothetical protein [Butyrivibrio sp. MC2013]